MKSLVQKRIGVCFATALIAIVSGCGGRDTIADLKANRGLHLAAVSISGFHEGQPFMLTLSEPGVLDYLTVIIRNATSDVGSGMLFSIKLQLSNGTESKLGLDLPKNGTEFYLWVSKPFPSDGKQYCVTLAEPIPKELSEVLSSLRSGQVTNRDGKLINK